MLSNNKKKFFFVFSAYELTILAHQCKIWSYFYDIMLILSKIHHFRIFQFYFTHMTVSNFLKQHKLTKFDMSFRMVYKLSHLAEKKFWSIFSIRWDLSQKNAKKNYLFCNVNLYTIRKPISNLVDLCCFKKFTKLCPIFCFFTSYSIYSEYSVLPNIRPNIRFHRIFGFPEYSVEYSVNTDYKLKN